MSSPPQRLFTLDALRGLAALMVCWFHFTNGNEKFLPPGFLKSSGDYGRLGVQVFFVISGFVIPYALMRSSYQIKNYGTFILKRIIRLDPPYLVAILIGIVLAYASCATPAYKGPPFHLSFIQLILHLGYANVLFGYPWINPVFWTLAIELQYYLIVGLLFPVISHRSVGVRFCCFGGLGTLAVFLPATQFVFTWLFLFMLGMVAFQYRVGIHQLQQFILCVVLFGLGAWYVNGIIVATIATVTVLTLGLLDIGQKNPLLFFGKISYSLYLLHEPVGRRFINLSSRFAHGMPAKWVVLVGAYLVSVLAAWLLYKFVERPAQQWSSRITYRKQNLSSVCSDSATPMQTS